MLNRNTLDSIIAVLVLVIPALLWFFVDETLLQKLAIAMLVAGGAAFFGVHQYMDRLDRVMRVLPDAVPDGRPFDLDTLTLHPFERKVLGIDDLAHPERIRRALQRRREWLVSIAMVFALCALMGLILLIVIHAD